MRNRSSSGQSRQRFAALLIAALCPFVASLVVVPGQPEHSATEARLAAQGETTIWDGVYTTAQATRGRSVYDVQCAECHAYDLTGGGGEDAPALAGSLFLSAWIDLTVHDLWTRAWSSMPPSAPATMSPASVSDITAYILQMNKIPAGDTELPADEDALPTILITAAP